MKDFINLFFCLDKLGAADRNGEDVNIHAHANNTAQQLAAYYNLQPTEGDRVFFQTPKDNVFSGYLENIDWHHIPIWVIMPRLAPYDSAYSHVYVQFPHAPGLLARLAHYHNYNNVSVRGRRCFIELDNNMFFIANLETRNQPLRAFITTPRVYVRIPDPNNTIYTGTLRHGRGILNFETP